MEKRTFTRKKGGEHSFSLYLLVIGVFASLVFPLVASATPPPDPHEQSVPVQLRLIREYLVDMEGRLSGQMTDMEGRLTDSLGNIQSSVDIGNSKLDILQDTADDIYDVVTAVNIDMTTTLCFDLNVAHEEHVGGHGEFGVGWPNVLDAKAVFEAAGSYGFGVGMGNQICIQVPLYSVESYDQLFTDTGEFDDLIAAIAMPGQNIVPLIADIYTKLMPTPREAVLAISNVIEAASGEDISNGDNDAWVTGQDVTKLARPDILLEPVIPDFVEELITNAPTIINTAIASPCTLIAQTPFGPVLDTNLGGTYDWLCSAHADAINDILTVVDDIFADITPALTIINKIWNKVKDLI